jgi:spore coat protein U domain-containing protein, fimbrial subunit CupE1/2/3/6
MSSIGRIAGIVTIACVLIIWAIPAQAAVSCRYDSVTGVAFGSYDVFSGTTTTSTGSLTFRCTGEGSGTVDVTVTLSKGNSSSYESRYMLSGATQLDYNLYIDPFGLFIWGDGTGGSSALGPLGLSDNQSVTLTIYGRLPAGQDVPAGSYSDTITSTVSY